MNNSMSTSMKIIGPATCLLFLFVSFRWGEGGNIRREKAFEVYARDSIRIAIELVYDAQDLPLQYTSHVLTPVCEDGLCHLVVIDLYWDLLGNFKKYQVPPDRPLTKFDHEPFT